jgi:hypothetical protein
MQKIDDCKEIRLALTRAGIASRPESAYKSSALLSRHNISITSPFLASTVVRFEGAVSRQIHDRSVI